MKRQTSTTTEDLLRVEGVGAKGFGIVPRYAMCDPDLSCYGKLLYAYLCSLAGSGNQTWPKRETIIKHLRIGKDTYYSSQKELLTQGYISVKQTRRGNRQGTNVYTLAASPPKMKKAPVIARIEDSQMVNRVIAHGLKAGGYGMMPRLVMIDERLSPKAKLVYAYLSSYAGAGTNAFPSTMIAVTHLKIYKEAWRRSIKELAQCNYLDIRQRRKQGRFDVCDYCLIEKPARSPERKSKDKTAPETGFKDTEKIPPETGFKDTEKASPETGFKDTEKAPPETGFKDTERVLPETGFRDTETPPETGLPDTGFRDTESTDTYFNYLSTVLSSNNNLSIYQQEKNDRTQNNEGVDRLIDYETVRTHLKKQLMLEKEDEARTIYGDNLQTAQELLSLLSDVLSGAEESFQLGRSKKPKAPLWELRPEHLLYVIESVRTQRSQQRIYNMRAYLLTALYHAPETLTAYQEGYAADCDRVEMQRNAIQENQREMAALLARLREE